MAVAAREAGGGPGKGVCAVSSLSVANSGITAVDDLRWVIRLCGMHFACLRSICVFMLMCVYAYVFTYAFLQECELICMSVVKSLLLFVR